MGRATLVFMLFLLVTGMAASAQHGAAPAGEHQPSEDRTDQRPGDDGQQDGPKKPGLPSQASNVAKNVIDTVFGYIGDTAAGIGNALQSLLGGGQAADQAEGGSGN